MAILGATMSDILIGFSVLVFAILITGDLSIGARALRARSRPQLLAAYMLVFWSSLLGFMLLPATAFYRAIQPSIGATERAMLLAVGGLSVGVIVGVFRVHRAQVLEARDVKLAKQLSEELRKSLDEEALRDFKSLLVKTEGKSARKS